MNSIKVLLVDDHTLVRKGIRALLQHHEDIEVVGEASDGREAIEQTIVLEPDVIIMDITMPSMGGVLATQQILKQKPAARILVLSRHENVSYIRSLLEAGASGYVSKKGVPEELAVAIRTIYSGNVYLHPSIAKTVTGDYVQLLRFEKHDDAYEHLTDREKEILSLVVEGNTIGQISEQLFIAPKTVANHKRNIMLKLGLNSNVRLIKYAIDKGLLDHTL